MVEINDTEQEDGDAADPGKATRSFRVAGHMIPARPLMPGLYLVATPIGNLGDMTIRALETLASVDIVCCEDTRVSRTLLDRYGIRARPRAVHEHNEQALAEALAGNVAAGRSVAFISDAGTPLVSDPGYRLARAMIERGLKVVPVPGASAPLAALAASGLPTDSFFFAGFLPAKDKGRRDRLAELAAIPATLILFESPHRAGDTLAAALDVLGDRQAALCRELTKAHEEVVRGPLSELSADMPAGESLRGEIVLVIGPPLAPEAPEEADIDALLSSLAEALPASKAAAEAARRTGLDRKMLYQRLLGLKADG